MDIVGSIRRFFNRKRLFVLEEKRSGNVYDKLDFSIEIDKENEHHDESLYLSSITNRYESIYVHAYSLKDAKQKALERIIADRKARLAAEREEGGEPIDHSVEAVIRSTVQAQEHCEKMFDGISKVARTWQQNREERESLENKRQLVVHKS